MDRTMHRPGGWIRCPRTRSTDRRRPMAMSQRIALLIVVASIALPTMAIMLNFALLWCERQPMSDVAVQAISTYGAIAGTVASAIYAVLSGGRDVSRDISGVTMAQMGITPPAQGGENNENGGALG